MWSRSQPPTPGQQPSFVCYWDPEGAERAIRRKFGHISAQQPESASRNDSNIYVMDNSMERNSQKLSNTIPDIQEHTDNNDEGLRSGTLFETYEEGRSDDSSPGSQKASDESSLSDPSWRMHRGLGDFRVSPHDVKSSRDGKIIANKKMEIGTTYTSDADKLDTNYEIALRSPNSTSTTGQLLDVKHLKVKHREPGMCEEQITPLYGRRYGQAFAQTNVQDGESNNFLSSSIGSETEEIDYFGDLDLAPLPSNSRITSNVTPERPSIKHCASDSADRLSSIDFKMNVFDKDTSIVSRPKHRHCASSSLLQKLRRETRSEEAEPFLEGYNPALRAPNLPTVADTPLSEVPKTKRLFKPQIFRASASVPIMKSRRAETAAAMDIPRYGIGRNRRAQRRTLRSSVSSDVSSNPLDDATSGSPPTTKEGILRKYWSLGLKNPLFFPIYLGTSKRSRLLGNTSPSLSNDERDIHDSSESQFTSELATPDSEHESALEANEANHYFRIRSNRLATDDEDDDDDEGGKPHIDIPDHLPSSPLCPLNAKYRGIPLAECPQHGKRHASSSVSKIE